MMRNLKNKVTAMMTNLKKTAKTDLDSDSDN